MQCIAAPLQRSAVRSAVSIERPTLCFRSVLSRKCSLPFQSFDIQAKQPASKQVVQSADAVYPTAPELPPERGMSEAAIRALQRATQSVKRFGWISFWIQLSLSIVSGIILLFSVAFTSSAGPKASLYLTLVGILAGFLSTFWNYGYTRVGQRMQQFLDLTSMGRDGPKIKKQQVIDIITKGIFINLVGLGSTLLGIQALVGLLVAKTLSNASVNPLLASASGSYNPVLALDVFLVQAATNTLLAHFLSMCCALWLLHVVGEGRPLRFQKDKEPEVETDVATVRGNAGVYKIKREDQ